MEQCPHCQQFTTTQLGKCSSCGRYRESPAASDDQAFRLSEPSANWYGEADEPTTSEAEPRSPWQSSGETEGSPASGLGSLPIAQHPPPGPQLSTPPPVAYPSPTGPPTTTFYPPAVPGGAPPNVNVFVHGGANMVYQQPGNNTLAVVSLVLSLVSFVGGILCGIFAIAAPIGAICGHISLNQLKTSGEQGKGMAIAGVIVGWIMTALLTIGIGFFIWAANQPTTY